MRILKTGAVSLMLLPVFCLPGWCQGEGAALPPPPVLSAVELKIKEIESKARLANSKGQHLEAANFFVESAALCPTGSFEAVDPLYYAAEAYYSAKEYEKAYLAANSILSIPVPKGVGPPGIQGYPFDMRGEACALMADARRKQGRWTEALALYQQQTYARGGGCVFTGAEGQQLALVEGACLENLGRFEEAVNLYWEAARYLSFEGGYPYAMQRLVDLYMATGQIQVLKTAAEQEKKVYPGLIRNLWGHEASYEFWDDQLPEIEILLPNTNFSTFERVLRFRLAAKNKNWDVLISTMKEPEGAVRRSSLQERVANSDRREAVALLRDNAVESIPALRRALQADPENKMIAASLALCENQGSVEPDNSKRVELNQILGLPYEGMGRYSGVIEFPKPPFGPRLPTSLPLPKIF